MEILSEMLQRLELSRWYKEIEPISLNSIRLINRKLNKEETLELGNSKFGGSPDLPANLTWPMYKERPLAFLAQIRLEDVVSFDIEGLLPSSGLLYFFYDAEQEPWGFEPAARDGWKVLYSKELSRIIRTSPPPYSSKVFEGSYNPCAIEFFQEISLPSWEAEKVQKLALTEQERENYFQLVSHGIIHRLLGHPATIQGEMEIVCQFASNGIYMPNGIDYNELKMVNLRDSASEWKLLLQIDSDENVDFYWGQGGRLYFWIRKEALKNHIFDNVWLVGQCT